MQVPGSGPGDDPLGAAPKTEEGAASSQGYALSFSQQRLWFLDQLEPNSPLYNLPLALHLQGALRVEFLRQAIQQIVSRHESLRTLFLSTNGTPAQYVQPPGPVEISVVDLSSHPAEKRESELWIRLGEAARRPFDLAKDCLLRTTLFRTAPDDHVVLFNFHHIACDEWSLKVFLRELSRIYTGLSSGDAQPLPELPIQFADYAIWQREQLQGPLLGKQLDYWKQQLADFPARLQLQTDPGSSGSVSRQGQRALRLLPPPTTAGLKELSHREGTTLFMTLLAAFKVLLYRHTGQEDIAVGSPIAGRGRVETEDLIGFFVNTLVLRTRLSGDASFRDVLRTVRSTTLGAYDHQDLPFEKLVEELHPDRAASHMPFVPIAFAHEEDLQEELILSGLHVDLLEVDTQTAKFDLTWVVRECAGSLAVGVEYATNLFSADAIANMLSQWETLLAGIIANPAQPIAKLPLLNPAERQRVLVDWNQTQRDVPALSLPALFEEQVRLRPEAMAVQYGSSRLTYLELDRAANQLAERLRQSRLSSDGLVGLCVEPSPALIIGMLGILKAGGAYVPLDPSYPKERLSLILQDARPAAVLTQEYLRPALPALDCELLVLDTLESCAEPAQPKGSPQSADGLAYVIYTSGSTGQPKGVLVTQRGVVRLVRNSDYIQLGPGDKVAQASNVSFDAATFEIWGALLNGATLVGIPREVTLAPRKLASQLAGDGITTLFLTTALLNQVAAEAPTAFRTVKHLLFGGEAVDPKWVRAILQHGPPARLLHVYGPTETTTFATWHLVRSVPPAARTIPIGRPIANTQIYLLDKFLEPVPSGIPGEIYIGGPGVARGYLHAPALSDERFVRNCFSTEPDARLYRTGDLARYTPEGEVVFIGRADNQVKIRGFRIEIGEVEAALHSHPAISEAVIVAAEDVAGSSKRLIGYVVPKEGYSLADVRHWLKERLPGYMVPAMLVTLRKLPLNPNGKVDRNALPAPDQARPELAQKYLPPRTPLEQKLAAVWTDVLGVERVGVQDDFFELGGHSLLAVRLFAEIEKHFGKKLPLASLFQSPTIEQLCEVIRADDAASSRPLRVDIQPTGTRPPFFWIHSLGGDGGGGFFYYRKLAQLLGPDQPSYGIRSPQEPFTRIEEMAAHYVSEILQTQPNGPYFLGGFCFGGVVAFEMARQLHARGREVALLALLESAPPLRKKSGVRWSSQAATSLANNLQAWLGDLIRQSPRELCSRLQRKGKSIQKRLQRLVSPAQEPNAPDLADFINMSDYPKDYVRYAQAHWHALLAYEPQPYAGRITLFRARKQPLLALDSTLGWAPLAQAGVAVNVIPGTHEKMLEEPNVQILAAELKTCLAEAQSTASDPPSSNSGGALGEYHAVVVTSCGCSVIT